MFTCFHAVAHIPAFHIHIFMLVFTVYTLFFRRLLLFCRILFYFHYFISRKFTGIDFVDISCLASFAICNTTEDDDGDAGGEREPLAVHIIHILETFSFFIYISQSRCGNDSYFHTSFINGEGWKLHLFGVTSIQEDFPS